MAKMTNWVREQVRKAQVETDIIFKAEVIREAKAICRGTRKLRALTKLRAVRKSPKAREGQGYDVLHGNLHMLVCDGMVSTARVHLPKVETAKKFYAHQGDEFGPQRWCTKELTQEFDEDECYDGEENYIELEDRVTYDPDQNGTCGAKMEMVFTAIDDQMWGRCPNCGNTVKIDDFNNTTMDTGMWHSRHSNDIMVFALYKLFWQSKYHKTWDKMKYFFKDGPCYCQEVADTMINDLEKVDPDIKKWLEAGNDSYVWKMVKYEKDLNKEYGEKAPCPFVEASNGDEMDVSERNPSKGEIRPDVDIADNVLSTADAMADESKTRTDWQERKFWEVVSKCLATDNMVELKQQLNWNRHKKWMTKDAEDYCNIFLGIDTPDDPEPEPKSKYHVVKETSKYLF